MIFVTTAYNNKKYKLTSLDFRGANCSMKLLILVHVCGGQPSHYHINLTLALLNKLHRSIMYEVLLCGRSVL